MPPPSPIPALSSSEFAPKHGPPDLLRLARSRGRTPVGKPLHFALYLQFVLIIVTFVCAGSRFVRASRAAWATGCVRVDVNCPGRENV